MFTKAHLSITFNVEGSLTSFKSVQLRKQRNGISTNTPSGISIDSIVVLAKAYSPMVFNVDGSLTVFKLLHIEKQSSPIVF